MLMRLRFDFGFRPFQCARQCAVLVFGLLFAASAGIAENVLTNPGFESGTVGWSGFGPVSFTAPTTLPQSGFRSALIQNRTAAWNGVAQSVRQVMQPGVTYTISAWVRLASGGSQPVQITLKKSDGDGTSYASAATGTATSTAWTQLNGSHTLSVAGTLSDLTLYLEGPAAGVDFYADEFIVGAPATVRVGEINVAVVRQAIDGFGGAIAFYNNWITAHPYKQEIYTNIFQGLNLGILRLGNWFRYQGTANFDADSSEIVSNANRILGRSIPIQMSSWSPPAFLKSNGTTGNGGTLVKTNGAFAYTNFANYWYDSLLWYKTNGIVPAWISIQNEPDWAAGWDSCVFHPTEDTVGGTNYASYSKALTATSQRLTNLPSPPKILGPEVVGIGYNTVQNYAATMDPGTFYGVAHHLYHGGSPDSADSFIPALRAMTNVFPGKSRFMTEYGETDMLQTALLLHHSLVEEEASAYVFWSLVWPVGGPALVQQENPWNRSSWTNAPAGTPTQSRGYWITPQYYALKHFSFFITAGYRRVETHGSDPDNRLSAYLSPDSRRLVAVIIHPNSGTSTMRLNVNGFTAAASAVYQTAGANAETSEFAYLGTAPGNLQWTLPGYSITTVVLDAPVFAGSASNPNPANGAANVPLAPNLTWLAGSNATSHRVFFGYDSNAVANATTASPEYQGTRSSPSFTPATLASTGRFYWRVDELAGTNVTKGATWVFTTPANSADAPAVAGAFATSNSFVVRFASRLGQAYRLELADSLHPPAWWPVADAIAGNGSQIQITNTAAPLPSQRFYRVLLLPQ